MSGTGRASLVRKVLIPRPDGSPHDLGIPTVTYCSIQQALLQVLQSLTETILLRYGSGMAIHELFKHDRCTGPGSSSDRFGQHPELPF